MCIPFSFSVLSRVRQFIMMMGLAFVQFHPLSCSHYEWKNACISIFSDTHLLHTIAYSSSNGQTSWYLYHYYQFVFWLFPHLTSLNITCIRLGLVLLPAKGESKWEHVKSVVAQSNNSGQPLPNCRPFHQHVKDAGVKARVQQVVITINKWSPLHFCIWHRHTGTETTTDRL